MSEVINKKRVGVLRGGLGEYYENSLREGGQVISQITENLSADWQPVDILIDRDGLWHCGGLPIKPVELINKVDVVWNASHPSFSSVLENLFIPNVGASSFSQALADSRTMLASHLQNIGVKMPRYLILSFYQKEMDGPRERYAIKKAKEVHEKFSPPWLVKSLTPDPNIGVHLAQTFPELVDAIEDITIHGKSILVEEFISDRTASVHSIPDFRGQELYTLPIGSYSNEEKEKLIVLSKDIYRHINAEEYLKSNFVLHPKRGIYLVGVEFLPDLKAGSPFEKSCEFVGTRMHYIVEHILKRVL